MPFFAIIKLFFSKHWKVLLKGFFIASAIVAILLLVNDYFSKRAEVARLNLVLAQERESRRVLVIQYEAQIQALNNQRRRVQTLEDEGQEYETEIRNLSNGEIKPLSPVLQRSYEWLFQRYSHTD